MTDIYDVAICGPAGLSVAIVLGRRRRVVLGNLEIRRRAMHFLIGHEGGSPSDLLARGRLELEQHSTVTSRGDHVIDITQSGNRFGCVRG